MAGLDVLGGIGKGLMQGSQFIHQARQSQQQQDLNNAKLSLLQEEADWKRQERESATNERQRLAELDQLSVQTWQEMGPDADPLQVSSEVFKRTLASGKARRSEIEPLLASVKELRQRGVTQALRLGDPGKLGEALSSSFGQRVSIQPTKGKDEFGRDSQLFAVMGEDGQPIKTFTMMQLGSILGADDILADQERQLKMEETRSKAVENQAQAGAAKASAAASYANAGKYNEQTRGERLANEGLAALAPAERARAGRGSGGPDGPLSTMGKEAADLVSAGLAKDVGEAMEMIRTDRSLGEALRIAAESPTFFTLPESQKAAAIRQTAQALRSGERKDPAGVMANDPLGLRAR